MLTGRERLEKRIKNLEAEYGPEDQLVKDYRAQLAAIPPPSESIPIAS